MHFQHPLVPSSDVLRQRVLCNKLKSESKAYKSLNKAQIEAIASLRLLSKVLGTVNSSPIQWAQLTP